MNILGIETSCDETAAAVVKDGREVLSSVVYTQIPLHQPYGGVVPEIASRAHIEKISEVVRTARDFRNDAAVGLVQGNLGVDDIGQDLATVLHHGRRGLIATRLYSKYIHFSH